MQTLKFAIACDDEEVGMTPQEQFERTQREAMPQQDLSAFQGMWVALRDGEVVASSVDAILLRENSDVTDADLLVAVPTAGSSILIA